MKIVNFEQFQYFNFKTKFLKNENLFQKTRVPFLVESNSFWPVTTLFFWKSYFSVRTSYKELIWCTNYPNIYIHTFCKRWSFIWGQLFLVSNLKITEKMHLHCFIILMYCFIVSCYICSIAGLTRKIVLNIRQQNTTVKWSSDCLSRKRIWLWIGEI